MLCAIQRVVNLLEYHHPILFSLLRGGFVSQTHEK